MLGQMMQMPLLVSSLIEHSERYHGGTEVISVETDGQVVTTNWREVAGRARQLAAALHGLNLTPQARCATLAWNNHRHLEIYFGTSGAGFVCHTMNPRLFPEQLAYIIRGVVSGVPWVGPITTSAIVATISDAKKFRTGHDPAAWLGLTPLSKSSGGKQRLGRISKKGDHYIRKLLSVGMTSLALMAKLYPERVNIWTVRMLAGKPGLPRSR